MPTPKGSIPWNKGKGNGWVDSRGYRWLYVKDGGKTVARREHRVVVEASIGRKLEPWELVHHKDGDKANNAIENLEVKEFGEHTAEHHQGTRKSQDAKRSMEAFALMREELRREREVKADLLAALQAALAVIKDYVEYEHNGDPWTEDARAMGEMDIDDYQRDGRLDAAYAAIAKTTGAA